MIQANELRKGSFFLSSFDEENNDKRICKVLQILQLGCYWISLNGDDGYTLFEDMEPIVLNPEILKRCGCINTGRFGGNQYYKIWSYISGVIYLEFAFTDSNIIYEVFKDQEKKKYFISIDSLHKFQNLIFALTGQELEYKND